MHRWSVLWSLSCARSPLENKQMKFCEGISRQDWQSGWSYTSSGPAEQHWKMSFHSPPAASVFADLEKSLEKNMLMLVFFWKAGFKALSDRLTTNGSRWSSCRNVNNYDWWVKMFRAATHWVTLIVPFCHPGWEATENLSGSLRKFERKSFLMKSGWEEEPQLMSPWLHI